MSEQRVITLSSYLSRREHESLPPLRSLPLPDGRQGPSGRLVALYGTRANLEGQREAITQAREQGMVRHRVEIQVPVKCTNDKINAERLPDHEFVLLTRVLKDLSQWLCQQLEVSARSHVAAVVASQPERLNALWSVPALSHVKLFAWDAPTADGHGRRMAAIREPGDNTRIVVYGSDEPARVEFA